MRAPVVIYYLVLFAFAATLAQFFLSLGNSLTRQYQLTEQAIRQEREVAGHTRAR